MASRYICIERSCNVKNCLTAMMPLNPQDGDKKTEYEYNYMSCQVWKKVYVYDTGSWFLDTSTTFVYDGWNLIREAQQMGEPQKITTFGS